MGLRFALILLLLPLGICAQQRAPFTGCASDGQVGPLDPPTGKGPVIKNPSLAYYKAEMGAGVLAPLGWHCFGFYGSGGATLVVTPQPINEKVTTPLTGPVIVLARHDGDTSGRFSVAEIIARVFPAYRKFVTAVYRDFPEFPKPEFGPYPAEKLTYKGDHVVEFQTPAMSEGLGVQSWIKADRIPIRGVAMLVKEDGTENVVVLSVRLPANLRQLAPTVIHQVEHDGAN